MDGGAAKQISIDAEGEADGVEEGCSSLDWLNPEPHYSGLALSFLPLVERRLWQGLTQSLRQGLRLWLRRGLRWRSGGEGGKGTEAKAESPIRARREKVGNVGSFWRRVRKGTLPYVLFLSPNLKTMANSPLSLPSSLQNPSPLHPPPPEALHLALGPFSFLPLLLLLRRRRRCSVRRLVLTPEGRTKLNTLPDREFYFFPRFVTHVDDGFIAALTELYRERLRPGAHVLDLMSSWVSHLPPEVQCRYGRVVGHGLNAQELARNPRLDHFFVKDLNRDHHLQLHAQSFDAVLCAVSVQYLQSPEKVFAEVFRVLKPGSVEGFTQPEVVKKLPVKADDDQTPLRGIMRLLGFSRSDPFYAVISYRNFKSTNEMQ
uniref:Methyltransferase type 11 domain-containing protein n=1 Tax=Ananas comosus var. bracteatus TaxID=296719 RepID=A0A6V7Q0K4_ANACO|nr:unnamed protein product [Ananas comosus var. bracteatus]